METKVSCMWRIQLFSYFIYDLVRHVISSPPFTDADYLYSCSCPSIQGDRDSELVSNMALRRHIVQSFLENDFVLTAVGLLIY